MPKDTNFAFNLSHVRMPTKEVECYIKNLPENVLAEIITYLPSREAM